MAIPNFLKLRTADPDLSRVQDNIDRTLRAVTPCPLLDGRLVSAVFATASAKAIAHGLGRTLVGWFLVDQDAQADVWRNGTANADTLLTLETSAAVTVSLWVF